MPDKLNFSLVTLSAAKPSPSVSLIIPTLNEIDYLERTLRQVSILQPPVNEIIIVDGKSEDGTASASNIWARSLFSETPVRITEVERGRSRQMNEGARLATGDYLCFLHADTLVPDDLVAAIARTLGDPSVSAGGFISLMCGEETTRWGSSFNNYLKTYYAPLLFRPHLFVRGLRLLFGDQAIFCRRQDFFNCGGFDPNLPILEEADLCLKFVRKGRIKLVNRIVQSSDRRIAKLGNPRATLVYFLVGFGWGFGVPAARLKRWYEEIR